MSHGINQLETRNWKFKGDQNKVKKVTVHDEVHFCRSPGRYYLEEFFAQVPGLNADIAIGYNHNWEVLGTNASSGDVTYHTTHAGVLAETDGTDNDQEILTPHLDSGQSAWAGVKWGTENQVIFETAIVTGAAITTVLYWVGLKLTNTPTIITDADQAFFRFSTDDSDTNWEVVYSIGGTDTTVDSGVAVAASTVYKFRIEIDADRIAKFYINDEVVATSTALTNDINFIPYIGVQQLAGSTTRKLGTCYVKISRILHE